MLGMGEKVVVELADLPDDVLAAVRDLPHVIGATFAAGTLTCSCEAYPHNLTDILDTLRSRGVELGRVFSEPPTLNDVFLEITGRELRD